jgi:TrmH family RNA methyltransferase
LLAGPPDLVAVAVDLSEPGNAGTLIRTAHAMGTRAVVLAGASVDPYNGKCLRSSAGSIFAIPVLIEPDPAGLLERLRGARFQILATTVDGESTLPDCEPLLGTPTAWVFGPESAGLEPALAAAADHRIRIPMVESAESLNVAAAAAICLYQSARARLQHLG